MRIAIIGAGAAGLAAAWSLGEQKRHEIDVWDRLPQPGGVATSLALKDKGTPGADKTPESDTSSEGSSLWINDQVQGATPTYFNLLRFIEQFGVETSVTQLRILFGSGESRDHSNLLGIYQRPATTEIRKFRDDLGISPYGNCTIQRLRF